MRSYLRVLATMWWLVTFTTGPAHADVPRTPDANGVLVGSWLAPVQLEIFCEPQCPYCAEMEATDGDKLATALADGRLAVTYRWLTFLNARHHNDVSTGLVNALFLAADPATPPTAYQAFVQDLYRHQSTDGPSTDAVATFARESGLPDAVIDRVAARENAVDAVAVGDANEARLQNENPKNPGTPTIYNLNTRSVVDTQDPGWLDALTS